MAEILVSSTRGWVVENIVRGTVVVLGKDAKIIGSCGDSHFLSYIRSSAKPLLSTFMLQTGVAEAYDLNNQQIAVSSSSHIGEDIHVQTITSILDKIGLTADDMNIGTDYSMYKPLREQRIAAGIAPHKLYHCCSGKHALMMATCLHMGWDIANYQDLEHPLQQYLLQQFAAIAELQVEDIHIGIDGCGVPVYALPLYNIGLTYYNLFNKSRMMPEQAAAADKVLNALAEYPQLISGTDQFCTEINRITKGRLIGKLGADGVYCLAQREAEFSLAVKTEDGNVDVMPIIVIRALRQTEMITEDEFQALYHLTRRDLTNAAGQKIGEMKAAYHLEIF